ncbi:hypothetical protein VpaJT1_30 [Vibrio phage VpaJT_1]|nr:hypothetical protein VpaJT1_30 [Vibrio phage VpaJT_1]
MKRTTRSNTEEFIEKARKVHGDRYDYSQVTYTKALAKVTIICAEHGSFEQTPNNHLRGKGCRACNGHALLNTEEFIRRATVIHGDRYDYSHTEYINAQTKLKINCKKHGSFLQIPYSHLIGKGCIKCRGEATSELKTLNTEHFIDVSEKVHQGKYDYSASVYTGGKKHITIICPTHGPFSQNAQSHMQGVGCAKCGIRNTDFNHLYLLARENIVKIGVSVDPDRRFKTLRKETPFDFVQVATWYSDEYDIPLIVEKFLHEYFSDRNSGFKGFDGATEWFNVDVLEVYNFITELLGAPSE